MLEIEVMASNESFKGVTQVYDQAQSFIELAERLINFPSNSKSVFHESGEKGSYAYFSLRFYPVDSNGIVGVQVSLEENVSTEFRPEEKSKLTLEILTEPWAIDEFRKSLKTAAESQSGKAQIIGR